MSCEKVYLHLLHGHCPDELLDWLGSCLNALNEWASYTSATGTSGTSLQMASSAVAESGKPFVTAIVIKYTLFGVDHKLANHRGQMRLARPYPEGLFEFSKVSKEAAFKAAARIQTLDPKTAAIYGTWYTYLTALGTHGQQGQL